MHRMKKIPSAFKSAFKWGKLYIYSTKSCLKCGGSLVFVKFKKGGEIRARCEKDCCEDPFYVSREEFFNTMKREGLCCPYKSCKKKLTPDYVDNWRGKPENYGLKCLSCGYYVWLADVIITWQKFGLRHLERFLRG